MIHLDMSGVSQHEIQSWYEETGARYKEGTTEVLSRRCCDFLNLHTFILFYKPSMIGDEVPFECNERLIHSTDSRSFMSLADKRIFRISCWSEGFNIEMSAGTIAIGGRK